MLVPLCMTLSLLSFVDAPAAPPEPAPIPELDEKGTAPPPPTTETAPSPAAPASPQPLLEPVAPPHSRVEIIGLSVLSSAVGPVVAVLAALGSMALVAAVLSPFIWKVATDITRGAGDPVEFSYVQTRFIFFWFFFWPLTLPAVPLAAAAGFILVAVPLQWLAPRILGSPLRAPSLPQVMALGSAVGLALLASVPFAAAALLGLVVLDGFAGVFMTPAVTAGLVSPARGDEIRGYEFFGGLLAVPVLAAVCALTFIATLLVFPIANVLAGVTDAVFLE